MKKTILSMALILVYLASYSQTFNSSYSTNMDLNFVTDMKDRVIILSDKEVSITNFKGGTKTLYLVVNKIENKDWLFDGVCKTYYCTTKEKDVVAGFERAIVYEKATSIVLAIFADEITVHKYEFSIK